MSDISSTAALPDLSGFSNEQLVQAVVKEVANRPRSVIEALLVRLTNLLGIHRSGAQVVDTLESANCNHRLAYNVYPDPRIGAAASCCVIAQNEKGELFLLMGKKEDKLGWYLPEGHMSPQPPSNHHNKHPVDFPARHMNAM